MVCLVAALVVAGALDWSGCPQRGQLEPAGQPLGLLCWCPRVLAIGGGSMGLAKFWDGNTTGGGSREA